MALYFPVFQSLLEDHYLRLDNKSFSRDPIFLTIREYLRSSIKLESCIELFIHESNYSTIELFRLLWVRR